MAGFRPARVPASTGSPIEGGFQSLPKNNPSDSENGLAFSTRFLWL
jgi:hypothetical protein